jgi:3-hydroxybutyryl-CoA dehydrogenase
MSSSVSMLKESERETSLCRIAVIGAGTIGCGVAQAAAESGFETTVLDISQDVLEQARQNIKAGIRMTRLLGKAKNQPAAPMRFTTDYAQISTADFIVENVTESWEIKRSVYVELDRVCAPHSVIAANTSVIPITRLASLMREPERVVGIHFMNPVPLVKAVEVIRGVQTSAETLEITRNFLESLGKEWIEVNDAPGFISNRVLMLAVNEAIFALQEQVATPEATRFLPDVSGTKWDCWRQRTSLGLTLFCYPWRSSTRHFSIPSFVPVLCCGRWSGRVAVDASQDMDFSVMAHLNRKADHLGSDY